MVYKNVYEKHYSYQPNMIQIKGNALYNWLLGQGYTHISVDDDDRYTAVNSEGKVESLMYVFAKRVPDTDFYKGIRVPKQI